MKKVTLITSLVILISSCQGEDITPTQSTNNTGTSSMVYSGDNITGYWQLDSVLTQFANVNGEHPAVIIDTINFTMEIYGRDDNFNKTSNITENSLIYVDNRPHGNLYGGLLYETDYFGTGIVSVEENSSEGQIYNTIPLQNRDYKITDIGTNNHLIVTAGGNPYNSSFAFVEYFHRVE